MAGTATGPFDPEGLSTVFEVPHKKTSYEPDRLSTHRSLPLERGPPSRDGSLNGSLGTNYTERAAEPPPVPYATDPRTSQHVRRISDGKLKKRNTLAAQTHNQTVAQTPPQRRGGLRNTIKRMFGRKSTRQRVSMPAAGLYQAEGTDEYSTTGSDVVVPTKKIERSASVPTSAFIRSSGLSSHPPFERPATRPPSEPTATKSIEQIIPPERPPRPRRSDVPSTSFTQEDLQAVTNAMSEVGLPLDKETTVDSRNIGFAVTPGSNPKRRSRSVEATRESDHRLSPIQWRHLRPRSDDYSYLRQSRDMVGKDEQEIENEPEKVDPSANSEVKTEDFNFGLQEGLLEEQERMGLEERLITLEIKLMDLEYTLSRLQAGSIQLSRRPSKGEHHRQQSNDTTNTYGTSSMMGKGQVSNKSSISRTHGDDSFGNRPTSVATTLKPGHHIQTNSFSNNSADWSKRLSLSALTIEHYTTLVTLVRHEQSARMRLEEQVSQLQQNFEDLQAQNNAPGSSLALGSTHTRDLSSSSQLSRRYGTIRDDGRRRAKYYLESRPRSNSYSTNETDTEDDYHDAFVTPTNFSSRGEYERGAFNKLPGVEDGEAF